MVSARLMAAAHRRQEAAISGGPLVGSLMLTAIVGEASEFLQRSGVFAIGVGLADAFFGTK